MKKIILSFATFSAILLASCSSDDMATPQEQQVEAPANYTFTRNGNSSVSYGGQSTRIAMAEELISAIKDNSKTEAQLDGMFAHVEGVNDFSDSDLNASSKSIRSKTAASQDYFSANTTDATAIKEQFDGWISSQVSDVFPNWDNVASAGIAGQLQEAGGGSTRYITSKGLELNQAVAKSLIGALMGDQMLNNYLGTAVLDAGDNRANNDNDVLAEGKDYTSMEHKWDEAFGYLYGAEANAASPELNVDSFMSKYLSRVEGDTDFAGIAAKVYDAFKLGRAAIVAKNYTVRDEQAQIIREEISKVIAVRAVYYLQQGKANLGTDFASAFHDLSEGFGFVYSLQFTRVPDTASSYFTKSEVDSFISQLMTGNGFWDVTPATLDEISNTIASEFGFTVAQAGS
jgi:ABC-type oligopeptide transport system substrate-binding subunit